MSLILRGKCVVVGDAGCGKSSLCQAFHSEGSYTVKNYVMTCGTEMLTKSVTPTDTKDTVEMYLYDSAGKEMFYESVRKSWSQPSMIMVVYDVTNELSFSSCQKWLERVRSLKPDVSTPGVLVANKTDMDARRVIGYKSGEELADKLGLGYFECSAKEMRGVDKPFHYLAQEYYRLYKERVDYITAMT